MLLVLFITNQFKFVVCCFSAFFETCTHIAAILGKSL